MNADTYKWDIVYDDGEQEWGLCYKCVRRFVPYKEGEMIEWRDESMVYWPAKVVNVNNDDTYDVQVEGAFFKSAATTHLRRMLPLDQGALLPGSRVIAKYADSAGWFPGELSGINSDGTYAVQFDDGDFLQQVDPRLVRPMQQA